MSGTLNGNFSLICKVRWGMNAALENASVAWREMHACGATAKIAVAPLSCL